MGGGPEHACQALTKLWKDYGLLAFGITDYVAPKMAPHFGAICVGELRIAPEKNTCRRLAE